MKLSEIRLGEALYVTNITSGYDRNRPRPVAVLSMDRGWRNRRKEDQSEVDRDTVTLSRTTSVDVVFEPKWVGDRGDVCTSRKFACAVQDEFGVWWPYALEQQAIRAPQDHDTRAIAYQNERAQESRYGEIRRAEAKERFRFEMERRFEIDLEDDEFSSLSYYADHGMTMDNEGHVEMSWDDFATILELTKSHALDHA